jgi:uncharacterized protein (DUF488 family)
VTVYTIGFTRKRAETFFELIRSTPIERMIDVRLRNVSQLAGFAKRDDLAYFLRELCGVDYLHAPLLAPTDELLDAYKTGHRSWDVYQRQFLDLLASRAVEDELPRDLFDGGCLLCSEAEPHRCHRRLVAEYLDDRWGDLSIVHLV